MKKGMIVSEATIIELEPVPSKGHSQRYRATVREGENTYQTTISAKRGYPQPKVGEILRTYRQSKK